MQRLVIERSKGREKRTRRLEQIAVARGLRPTYIAMRSSATRSITGPTSLITKRRMVDAGEAAITMPIRPPIDVPTQSYALMPNSLIMALMNCA